MITGVSLENNPTLEVNDLRKLFPVHRGIVGSLLREPERHVHAVDGISFSLQEGEILALVGESGSGKTTTGMCVLGLTKPTEGKVLLEGMDVVQLATGRDKKMLRRKAQLIFQDPYESLNPRQTVFRAVSEALGAHQIATTSTQKIEMVVARLKDVGLKPPSVYLDRFPQQLSGGQRQRVGIASALALDPSLLVADEPVSMLDVSVRAEILNLLLRLRNERSITMIYITHDLSSAAYLADRVAVMYLGKIVEIGATKTVIQNPQHPYTKALMSVIPVPNPRQRTEQMILQGETPDPIDLPTGCRFHLRCPVAVERCSEIQPDLIPLEGEHRVACLLVEQSDNTAGNTG